MISHGCLKADIDLPLREKIKSGIVNHRGDFGYPLHKTQRGRKKM